ncbi:isochorismatase family protein [Mangrovibacterium lignilyticum]|uniref:isochorismatase family protein n=1 Tax=Mangrovibacterium lignilyticum TaxID=2668052 RepID=UPI0013D27FB0|nr:isochorismatase family protein [Mangrovibacterium lignilyticum]
MKALLIVDVQNDFCPGGALPAPDGNKIVPVINALMDKFSLIFASKDWHPEETVHFGKWPVHCVRETAGAAFHQDLQAQKIGEILLKGTGNKDDGYSAFEATNIDFKDYLRRHEINNLYICGLTTEYCIKATAVDSQRFGFQTYVVEDAIKGVEQNKGDAEKAIQQMKNEGIQFINSSML